MICRTVIQTIAFQSTPPARGATHIDIGREVTRIISIHAPREGGDAAALPDNASDQISIHAPREGGDKRGQARIKDFSWNFNPRPPRGGRPGKTAVAIRTTVISIHAPREGGDLRNSLTGSLYPGISIHAPREGGDST